MSPFLVRRLSDESLGSRLASGEAAAFDELYRRYVHRLAAYGAHLLGDGAAGDDVAQSTLMKAYGALRDGRVPDRMKPWLYRIAHNVAIDLVSRRREWPTAELPDEGSSDPAPIGGALIAALATLPDRQRQVYVLRELHGLRIDETAAELSLSAPQVEQSLFAARNRLAEHLVFGDRLTCVSVQRLAAGPLDGDERRALKSHLRSCPGCREGLGVRGRALSVLPVTSLDWLRGLVAGTVGGGAPVAAKVGAVVATVSFAAGVPAAVETVPVHRLAVPHPTRASATARKHSSAAKALVPAAAPRPDSAPIVVAQIAAMSTDSHRAGRDGSGDAHAAPETAPSHDGSSGGSSGDSSSGSSGDSSSGSSDGAGEGDGGQTSPTVATPAAVVQTPTHESSDSGSSGSGSTSGSVQVQSSSDGGGDPLESSGGSSSGSSGGDSHDGGGGGGGGGGGDVPTTTVPTPGD